MEGGGTTSVGTLSNAPDGRSLTRVYEFVSSTLVEWANIDQDKSNSNENDLTNEFCRVLNQTRPAEYPFSFHHQNIEDPSKNTSTDFAVFENTTSVLSACTGSLRNAIVKFEAKRLTHGLGENREKEYVIGEYAGKKRTKNSGAIERFKNETHGKDVSNAAVLAYVQRDKFDKWETKVNAWINEQITRSSDNKLTWSKSNLLSEKDVKGKVVTFKSVSERKTQSAITIKHFWVDLVVEDSPS